MPEVTRSTLNFENPPEDRILTQEKLNELLNDTCERGEYFIGNMGQFLRLAELEYGIWYVPIGLVVPNPDQPRTHFDDKKLDEIETAIQDRGQDTAATVVPFIDQKNNLKLLIEGGERRYKALNRISAKYMKVEIKWRSTYKELYEAAGFDNFDREDPNPIDEAEFFKRLIEWSMEADDTGKAKAMTALSKKSGKSVQFIKNRLKLLETSDVIRQAVIEGLPPHIGIEIANLAKKGDNRLSAELQAVRILLDDPEKDYESEAARIKDLSKLTIGQAQEVMKAILASTGGDVGEETAARVDAAKRIIGFSSALTTIINQSRRLVAEEALLPTIISTMQERRGYPPDIVLDRMEKALPLIRGIHRQIVQTATETKIPAEPAELQAELEKVRDLLTEIIDDLSVKTRGFPTEIIQEKATEAFQRLSKAHREVVIPALTPPPLEIPEGSPGFFEQLKQNGAKLAKKSALKFRIAKILADASDENGKLLNASEITDKLRAQGIEVSEKTVSGHILTLDDELTKMGLRVDIQVLRIRDKKSGTLKKSNTYRLKWIIKR